MLSKNFEFILKSKKNYFYTQLFIVENQLHDVKL